MPLGADDILEILDCVGVAHFDEIRLVTGHGFYAQRGHLGAVIFVFELEQLVGAFGIAMS